MKVLQTFKLSKQLSESVGEEGGLGVRNYISCYFCLGVKAPHEALIMPELYLHYSAVFLYGNKSLSFRVFADQVIANEEKSAAARRKVKR